MTSQPKPLIPNSILVQLAFLVLILFVFYLLASNLVFFLPGFLGALCLFVLLLTPYRWMTQKKGWNKNLSIISLMLGSSLLVLAPLYLLIQTLTEKVLVVLQDKDKIQAGIESTVRSLRENYNIDIFNENTISKATELGTQAFQAIVNTSVNSVVEIGVAYLMLYFLLKEYQQIQAWLTRYLPMQASNMDELKVDMKRLVVSNSVGVPLTAFIQGIVAFIGYLIFGVEDAFVFFILTAFASLLPVVGAAVIYVPLIVMMLANGQQGSAIGLLIYCLVVVGTSDNLIRFLLQKKMADVHPLITIFGVIVGVNVFGFIGIIFGPILFSLFMWLVKIYYREFVEANKSKIIEK
ncbi:AI-2E family transporter [Myroides sp. 1354]|uniref:AI-2E family transporter n=1 Tax=unclassified Myroides TaxID=2642485 RepID=UPI002575D9C9|nr:MULTISPECIES: AI-2E family transporter [unclassified Myroides]MDM1044886.1 AI-2E family transporter [Myroides sp. R163-1]MDM1055599.1 AI-2E family transporter [Myroides sp. 1354]MDM1068896.1 AI-2E family transporter [Myroides sp. 1372]